MHSGAARFGVAVQAESVPWVLSLVGDLYPGGGVRVKFPIDPEGLFVTGPAVQVERVEPPKAVAA